MMMMPFAIQLHLMLLSISKYFLSSWFLELCIWMHSIATLFPIGIFSFKSVSICIPDADGASQFSFVKSSWEFGVFTLGYEDIPFLINELPWLYLIIPEYPFRSHAFFLNEHFASSFALIFHECTLIVIAIILIELAYTTCATCTHGVLFHIKHVTFVYISIRVADFEIYTSRMLVYGAIFEGPRYDYFVRLIIKQNAFSIRLIVKPITFIDT